MCLGQEMYLYFFLNSMHIVRSVDILNTKHISTKVSFVFHIFWFPKIAQSFHFMFNSWLDQYLILFFGIPGVLNIDN